MAVLRRICEALCRLFQVRPYLPQRHLEPNAIRRSIGPGFGSGTFGQRHPVAPPSLQCISRGIVYRDSEKKSSGNCRGIPRNSGEQVTGVGIVTPIKNVTEWGSAVGVCVGGGRPLLVCGSGSVGAGPVLSWGQEGPGMEMPLPQETWAWGKSHDRSRGVTVGGMDTLESGTRYNGSSVAGKARSGRAWWQALAISERDKGKMRGYPLANVGELSIFEVLPLRGKVNRETAQAVNYEAQRNSSARRNMSRPGLYYRAGRPSVTVLRLQQVASVRTAIVGWGFAMGITRREIEKNVKEEWRRNSVLTQPIEERAGGVL